MSGELLLLEWRSVKFVDQLLDNVEAIWGLDRSVGDRGYILEDGSFVNFGNQQDHRDILEAFMPEYDHAELNLPEVKLPSAFPGSVGGNSRYMMAFMYYAKAVRYSYGGGVFHASFIGRLSNRQKTVISGLLGRGVSEIYIDKFKPDYTLVRNYVDDDVFDIL